MTDCFDGSHQVSFVAVPNGKYQVTAYIDSKQMAACPLALAIVAGSTSAASCTVQGRGLQGSTAGTPRPLPAQSRVSVPPQPRRVCVDV